MGYDHETDEDYEVMKGMEERVGKMILWEN